MSSRRMAIVLVASLFLPGCGEPEEGAARIAKTADGHNEYEVYDTKRHAWLGIMLPHTEFEATIHTAGEQPTRIEGKTGHPVGLGDFASKEDIEEFSRGRKLEQFTPMDDGIVVVKVRLSDPVYAGFEPTWTVWTPELLAAVIAYQNRGNTPP